MITTKTTEQILRVLSLVRGHSSRGTPVESAYHDAVREVADEYSVTYQTIGDGCRRRLGLNNVGEFLQLVTAWLDGDGTELERRLKASSGRQAAPLIEEFFAASAQGSTRDGEMSSHEIVTLRLAAGDARLLRALAELEGRPVAHLATQFVSRAARETFKALASEFAEH